MSTFDQTQWRSLLFPFFFFFLVANLQVYVEGAPQVPCYFIFGDSLADNGNNNNRNTLTKSNFLPYGVDFPVGPTGRYTNNQTIVDVITLLLGFDAFIKPFATATGQEVLRGVNYASGGGGIRDETGRNLGDVISMNEQLRNHFSTVSNIYGLLRNITAAREHLSRCIYTVGMGSNDYINNYFMPDRYLTSLIFTPQQFADVLVEQYELQLKILYFYGARKVAVFGLGLIGGAPAIVARLGANAPTVTAASQLFTNKLPALVNKLNSYLPGAKFTYINITGISLTAASLATVNIADTCCVVNTSTFECIPNLPPCSDRDAFAFFDGFHPSNVVNVAFGGRSYNELLPSDASPYDIRTLALL